MQKINKSATYFLKVKTDKINQAMFESVIFNLSMEIIRKVKQN